MRLARRAQSDSESIELISTQDRLDPAKHRPLLVPDVIPQKLAETIERQRVNRGGLEITNPPPDIHMLNKHTHHISVIRPDVTHEHGKEQLLLETEMPTTLRTPETQRLLTNGPRIHIEHTLQPKRQLKRHMMLTRQHRQLTRPPHHPIVHPAPSHNSALSAATAPPARSLVSTPSVHPGQGHD